jgi:hypothetical protein
MSTDLNVNEYLFLNKLHSRMQSQQVKGVSLPEFHSALELPESFFVSTLKVLSQKKLVQIGFLRRGKIVSVFNWEEKYPSTKKEFSVNLSKKGLAALEKW